MLDEPLIADGVAFALSVLAAVDLNDKPLLSTDKIRDIRPDRLLTHEFESAKRAGAKVSPKLSFGVRRIFPQLTGQTILRYVCATHAARPPHPSLSPRAGRGSRGRRVRALASRRNARRAHTGASRKPDTFIPARFSQAKLVGRNSEASGFDFLGYRFVQPSCNWRKRQSRNSSNRQPGFMSKAQDR